MEENQTNEEKNMRVNVKQTAKGFAYYDVTVKGDTKEEVSKLLDEGIEIAVTKCEIINDILLGRDKNVV